MTDEQRQRIWEIENSCDGRTELAERIVGLEDKLAMYENDHQIALRTYGSWKRLKAEVPTLRVENAKLRELVKAFDWCTENFDIRDKCSQCPLTQRSALDPECEVIMRELGMKGNDA